MTAFLGQLHGLTHLASTVPANGDVNPYGVAVVPASAGRLTAGDILVSNFNDKANVQGTGRHRPDHGPGHPARRLGGGRQPADLPRRRAAGPGSGRLPHRAE